MQRKSVILGTYNLVPEGTEEQTFEEIYQVSWRPFLSVLYRFPEVNAVLHYSGTVLHWLEARHPEFIMLLKEMTLRKQIELLGGAFFSPLMPLLPAPDRLGQVELLSTFLRRSLGKRPRGCWLPEYAWEPSLASSLQACDFDYTFLPIRQFRQAGVPEKDIGAPVMVEDQGRSLVVFPVFDAVEGFDTLLPMMESLDALGRKMGEQRLFTLLYPGQASKDLWEASKLESPDVFYERSFAALQRASDHLETTTPSRYLKSMKGYNRAYFAGCASAQLMRESLASDKESQLKSDAPSPYFGSPRRLLLRHEESLALYAKMHYVRILVNQLRGDKSRKKTAQEELWKGQCGGAYWQGQDGGIARLPIRAAAYASLIEAEKITRQRGAFSPGIIFADLDFDGAKEIVYQGADINAYVQLSGGCLTELDSFKTKTNYVNVFNVNDQAGRKLCFRDHISERNVFGADKADFAEAAYALLEAERPSSVASLFREGHAELGGKRRALAVKKNYSFRKGGLSVDYEIVNKEQLNLGLRFCVELNLAAGYSPDTVLLHGIRGRDEMSLETAKKSSESDLNGLRLSNLSKAETIELRSDLPFALAHSPVSILLPHFESPAYQGCSLILGWDMDLPSESARRFSITLELRS